MFQVVLGNLIIYVANADIYSLILIVGYLNHIVVHFTDHFHRNIICSDFFIVVHNGINRFAIYFPFR